MDETVSVAERMQVLIEQWEKAGDGRADFLRCYSLMTGSMLSAIEAGDFHDREWVGALLRHFAEYYFVAVDDYEQGSEAVPSVWRLAHDAARQGDAWMLQNLLLGINAHINYDLVLALVDMLDQEWQSLTLANRQLRYEDHCHVNAIIGRTVDAVQDQVVERRLPAMSVLDEILGPVDELLASRMIAGWREAVWNAAIQMLDCSDMAERERLRREVEAEALRRAQTILTGSNPTALV